MTKDSGAPEAEPRRAKEPAEEPLAVVLHHADVEETELDTAGLRRLWSALGGDAVDFDDFRDAVAVAVVDDDPQGSPGPDDGFDLRVGRWRIDLRRASVRAGLMAAILAGVLAQQGLAEASIATLTAIIPSVIEIEGVALAAGDRKLLLELRLRPEVRDRFLAPEELYGALPPEVRQMVNPYDFANFLQRLRQADLARADQSGALLIGDPDASVPLIRLRSN